MGLMWIGQEEGEPCRGNDSMKVWPTEKATWRWLHLMGMAVAMLGAFVVEVAAVDVGAGDCGEGVVLRDGQKWQGGAAVEGLQGRMDATSPGDLRIGEGTWTGGSGGAVKKLGGAGRHRGGVRCGSRLREGVCGTGGASGDGGVREESAGSRVELRLYGGWRQLRGGDVNEAVANTTLLTVKSVYEGLEGLARGDAPATRRGREFGADAIVNLTSGFGLMGGVGWIASASEGRWIETPGSMAIVGSRSSASLRLDSIAVRLGGQYGHALSRRLRLVMDGGAGLYFTRLRWWQRGEIDFFVPTTSEILSDVRGYGLGFHGGVSVDVSVGHGLGLVIGVQGVHAAIGGLEGFREHTYTGFSSREGGVVTRSTRQDGRLAVAEFDNSSVLRVVGPAEEGSVREATVGVGGLRYAGGLRVSF